MAEAVLGKLMKLARSIDGDIFVVGGDDAYQRAMVGAHCDFCSFELDRPEIKHYKVRTERLAAARNQLLDHVLAHAYEYLVLVDLDHGCSMNASLVRELERRPHLAAVSFLHFPERYWDIWALRASWYPDSYMRVEKRTDMNVLSFPTDALNRFRSAGLDEIPVWSAFMMLAVYRVAPLRITGCRYGHTGVMGEMECEHVILNKCLHRNGHSMAIIPRFICFY